jgi:hypothetical protein
MVFFVVEPFARPCARSTTAARRRDSGPPPGLSDKPSNPLRHPVAIPQGEASLWRRTFFPQPPGIERVRRTGDHGRIACVTRVTRDWSPWA